MKDAELLFDFFLRITYLHCSIFQSFFKYSINKVNNSGGAVTVKMTCNSGHKEEWSSSKKIGTGKWSMPYVNLLIIVYAFLSGIHFDQLKVGILTHIAQVSKKLL